MDRFYFGRKKKNVKQATSSAEWAASHFKFSFLHVFASVSFCILKGWTVDTIAAAADAAVVVGFSSLFWSAFTCGFLFNVSQKFQLFSVFLSFAFIYLLRSVHIHTHIWMWSMTGKRIRNHITTTTTMAQYAERAARVRNVRFNVLPIFIAAHSKPSTIIEREREREKERMDILDGRGGKRMEHSPSGLNLSASSYVHFKQSFGLTWFYLNSTNLNFMHWIKLVVKVVTILISFSQKKRNSHFHSSSHLSLSCLLLSRLTISLPQSSPAQILLFYSVIFWFRFSYKLL